MGQKTSKVAYVKPELLEKDISGQNIIITGGNGGIGFFAAKQLALQGANIIIGCRRVEAGEEAAAQIKATEGLKGDVDVLRLDLSDYDSVRSFAAAVNDKYPKIDILVNNAGVMGCELSRNKQGHEMQMSTNYFGHWLLTTLLLDKLKASAPSRIINVSSSFHVSAMGRRGYIDFDDMFYNTRPYDKWEAYAQSKLANILHTRELTKRLAGTGVHVYSIHPGWVNTSLMRHQPGLRYVKPLVLPMLYSMGLIEPWEGIQCTLQTTLAPIEELEDGGYYAQFLGEDPSYDTAGWPRDTSKEGQDDEAATRLWNVAEELTA